MVRLLNAIILFAAFIAAVGALALMLGSAIASLPEKSWFKKARNTLKRDEVGLDSSVCDALEAKADFESGQHRAAQQIETNFSSDGGGDSGSDGGGD